MTIRSQLLVGGMVCWLAGAGQLEARVYAPRVVVEHQPDTYSMRTFAQFHGWRDLEGDARAWTVFQYLTDERTGLYPMGAGAWEGSDETYDFGLVRDPVKMINVYPLGYCDVLGPVMAGIWQDAGFGRARTVDLPEWQHVASEVYYDGGWHYLDLDLRAAFRRPDGSLASLAEAKRDDSLWQRAGGPRFFPMDDLAKVREIYRKTPVRHRYGVHQSGHTMDFILRQGETFTRWWKPQGPRWHHHSSYNEDESRQKLLSREPRGPKSKHERFTVHTFGNGRLQYEPNLTAQFSDFADGVDDFDNVRPGQKGLTLETAGEGYAVFEVRLPYVIVPLVGDMKKPDDDTGASLVEIDASGVSVEVSVDNGITWEPQKIEEWPARLDLTKTVAGKYGYLLKLILKGKPGQAVVRSLKMDTWVQLAPASLPALREGVNRFEYRAGDHYGQSTRVVEITPDVTDPIELGKYLVYPPDEHDPKSRTNRLVGEFVLRVAAPPDSRISWFSAGGSFRTHQGEAARKTANRMAYAVGEPAGFVEFYRSDIPTDQQHWHYNAQREIRLDEPAKTVFLRYTGDPAVNAIRVYAHVIDDRPFKSSALHVRHTWQENGREKTFQTTVEGTNRAYQIEVNGKPQNLSIELSVPSEKNTED